MILLWFTTSPFALTASFATITTAGSDTGVLVILTCGLMRIKRRIVEAWSHTILSLSVLMAIQ